jgi:hypothetical protein
MSRIPPQPTVPFTSETYRYRDDPNNYDKEGELKLRLLSCDTVRKKIRGFLETKEMTQTAFLKEIRTNPGSFRNFMSYRGSNVGCQNNAYYGSLVFFAERDIKAKMREREQQMTTAVKSLTTTIDDKTLNTDSVGHQNEKRSLEESDTKEDNGTTSTTKRLKTTKTTEEVDFASFAHKE